MTPAELAALGRCPLINGTGDPHRCGELECRLHNYELPPRGRPSARRLRAQREIGEACAGAVEHAYPHRGIELTQREVGERLGTSKQAVAKTERRAIRKLRAALRAANALRLRDDEVRGGRGLAERLEDGRR